MKMKDKHPHPMTLESEDKYIDSLFNPPEGDTEKIEDEENKHSGALVKISRVMEMWHMQSSDNMFDIPMPIVKIDKVEFEVIGSILRSLIDKYTVESVYDIQNNQKVFIYIMCNYIFALPDEYEKRLFVCNYGYGKLVEGRFTIFNNEGKLVFIK